MMSGTEWGFKGMATYQDRSISLVARPQATGEANSQGEKDWRGWSSFDEGIIVIYCVSVYIGDTSSKQKAQHLNANAPTYLRHKRFGDRYAIDVHLWSRSASGVRRLCCSRLPQTFAGTGRVPLGYPLCLRDLNKSNHWVMRGTARLIFVPPGQIMSSDVTSF